MGYDPDQQVAQRGDPQDTLGQHGLLEFLGLFILSFLASLCVKWVGGFTRMVFGAAGTDYHQLGVISRKSAVQVWQG